MSIDTEERSRLAKDSYNNREKGRIYNVDGLDYKILETTNSPSGYQATAYQRVDTGEVVIANRGTEFNKLNRQPLLDGATDLGMVRDGHNSQLNDAMDFTQKAIVAAKRTESTYHHPIEITTTGHSLGGTLAEITAYRFKLGGESFNSYGAVGLQYGIPEKVPAGYPGFTNHVRATDVVSAGSAHYGEVKTYATAQDIERLRHAGYIDPANPAKMPNAFIALDISAHFVNNFAPDKGSTTPSILSAADQKLYQDNRQAIEHYRSDVMQDRKVLSGEWAGHMTPAQRTQRLENIEAQATEALGYEGAAALLHGATHRAEQKVYAPAHAALHDARAIEKGAHAVAHETLQDARAVEHGVHAAAHTTLQDARAVEQGVHAAAHDVLQGARGAEHAVHQTVDKVLQDAPGSIVRGVHTAEAGTHFVAHQAVQAAHTVEQGTHQVAHDVVQGARTLEQGAHHVAHEAVQGARHVEQGAHHLAHEAVQGARAVEQRANQYVEQGVQSTAHVTGEVFSQGFQAAERFHQASSHVMQATGDAVRKEASQAYETLSHPGSWFDHDKPVTAPAHQLDNKAHVPGSAAPAVHAQQPSPAYLDLSAKLGRITKAVETGDRASLHNESAGYTNSAAGHAFFAKARETAGAAMGREHQTAGPSKPHDPRESGHPDHALNQNIREQLRSLHMKAGIYPSDARIDPLTAAVALDAREHRMSRVDHLQFNADKSGIVATQGSQGSFATYSVTAVQPALQTPPEQSYQQMAQVTQQQVTQQQVHAQQQQFAQSQQAPQMGR
jgi:hypothetical protein